MVALSEPLEKIRQQLRCARCEVKFEGTKKQALRTKYEIGTRVYCTRACRLMEASERLSRPIPERGPCKQCGQIFLSRRHKIYCSIRCYTASPQFAAMLKASREKSLSPESIGRRSAKIKNGANIQCLECQKEVYASKKSPRKYCSHPCYRAYMAKRFDRWMANPSDVGMIEHYDEFLEQEELQCIIHGCSWRGSWLTTHVNAAHGIKNRDFKRSAGFNLTTGVISRPVAVALANRPQNLVLPFIPGTVSAFVPREKYFSREAREHSMKARLLSGSGPEVVCPCGKNFVQFSKCGRAIYCEQCRPRVRQRKAK